MTHLLVIVLLVVFLPVALATLRPLLGPVLKLLLGIICAPFYTVGVLVYALCRAPGVVYRGFRSFVVTGGAFELLRATAICAAVTLLLMPLFP